MNDIVESNQSDELDIVKLDYGNTGLCGSVASLIKVLTRTMEKQNANINDIATMQKSICEQMGIKLPECFVYQDNSCDIVDPLIDTIRILIDEHGFWQGTCIQLLEKGRDIFGVDIAQSAKSLGFALSKMDKEFISKGILHKVRTNGNASKIHHFSKTQEMHVKRDYVKDFIIDSLRDGELLASELAFMAKERGYSTATIQRAKAELAKEGKIHYFSTGYAGAKNHHIALNKEVSNA